MNNWDIKNLFTRIRFLILSSLVIMLYGCFERNFEEVSESFEYRSIVGTSYRTTATLVLHEVTNDPKSREFHEYLVTDEPGIGGRRVLRDKNLEIGEKIKVKRAMLCTNCPFFFDAYLVVDILTEELDKSKKVSLQFTELFTTKSDGAFDLNANYFKRI